MMLWNGHVSAEDTGLPPDYQPNEDDNRDLSDYTGQNRYGIPWHQFKNILTSETVEGGTTTVKCEYEDYDNDDYIYLPEENVRFRLYNSTTQETEAFVTSGKDGELALPRMKRGHTYILMCDTSGYQIMDVNNIYLLALDEGDLGAVSEGVYEHKKQYIRLEDNDPIPDNYLRKLSDIDIIVKQNNGFDPMYYDSPIPVEYDGQPAPDGIRIRFTNAEYGTVEAVTSGGKISPRLVEDTDYTVHVDDELYGIETFALAVKDKSEHKYIETVTHNIEHSGKFTYDHTCCRGKDKLVLIDREDVSNYGTVSSLKKYGNTDTPQVTVSGMDFKTLLLLVRYPSVTLPDNCNVTDYDAVELTLANPHRWEKCKITETEFTVTQMLPQKRTVMNVYQLRDGSLEKLSFTQKSKESVVFRMDSMSLYPVIIEYAEKEPDPPASKPAVKPATVTAIKPTVTLSKTQYTYTGKTVKPAVTVKNGKKVLSSSEYSVSYSKGRKKVGSYKVTVTLKGKYTGRGAATFMIVPKGTKIRSPKAGEGKLTVSWKKQTVQTNGYQVQCSTSAKFAKAKSVKIKNNRKNNATVKGLSRGKKYYVRVRTYKKVNGRTYWSAWSNVKTAKVK